MAAPTSARTEVSTLEAENDHFRERYAPKMAQTGTRFYQRPDSSNFTQPLKRDAFKIDIDAYDTSMDIAPTSSSSTSDLRQRAVLNGGTKDHITGPIQPFARPQQGVISKLMQEFWSVIGEKEARRVVILGIFDIACMLVLLLWCQSTNSMALSAYTYLTVCDLMLLVTCLITVWVSQQKPVSVYSFGFERFEVLSVFSCTMLAIFGAIFIMKESTERLFQPVDIHTGRLMLGAGLGLICHITVTYGANSKAFRHVIEASRSSWLQEHFADMSRNFCAIVPGFDRLLLPRVNPFVLIAMAGALSLLITDLLVDVNNYFVADTLAAICIALMTFGTMLPMSIYTGTILLQTSPTHIIGQLDKSLREASTLDGVLEFRNEHFWTVSFGAIAGSLHVRVRRDANEQMVLAHVANKLSHLVSTLTIQVIKDDWTRLTPLSSFPGEALSSKLPPPAPLNPNFVASNPGLNVYSAAATLQQQKKGLYDFQIPTTPSRASSTPYGTPSRDLSFHSGIGPISTHGESTSPMLDRYNADTQLKGILRTGGMGPRGLPPNMANSRPLASSHSAVIDLNSLGTANLYTPGKILADHNHLNFDS
ncbi:zinc transporter 6-A-like [Patiria miniata]|uniref:Cation efflux protein transmembrane domain-containing protein n=1 Tax=Patiria miniata TaxID=46514 RepID=A0A914BAR5_PATMI|nr:zinc transporter 6-A-like [Patiria miniata]